MKKFKFNKVSIIVLAIAFTLGLGGIVTVRALGGLAEPVDLGVIDSFAVLAGSAVNDTNISVINGDVGLSPAGWGGSALTCGEVVTGTVYSVDDSGPAPCVETNTATTLTPAQGALTTAYGSAAGQSTTDTINTELGGTTLPAGVYVSGATTFEIEAGHTLTLDGGGNPDAVFIFNMASDAASLVTGANSKVELIGEAQACNVFWRVGGSAVLGTETNFVGTIMADQSITDNGGSTVAGRFLARIAAVTLNNTHITVPTCVAPDDTEEDVPSPSHSSSGSTPTYGCKDPTATNYNYFSSSRPELCTYASVAKVVTPTVIVPKLPKTGFPPETWYESLLSSFLNLFR